MRRHMQHRIFIEAKYFVVDALRQTRSRKCALRPKEMCVVLNSMTVLRRSNSMTVPFWLSAYHVSNMSISDITFDFIIVSREQFLISLGTFSS